MNVFNPAQFRAQFPALQDAGVYLDSAATALKPEAVVEATRQFYSLSAGNVHRSQFAEAQRLTARYEAAREKVAQLLNAPDDKTIVWTRAPPRPLHGGAMLRASVIAARRCMIVSEAEHHAKPGSPLMVAKKPGTRRAVSCWALIRLTRRVRLELITSRSRILAPRQDVHVTGLAVRTWHAPLKLPMPAAWW
ncbi:aminotransferase class V-fold PLP-dependent enzyme [Shigella flexneri]